MNWLAHVFLSEQSIDFQVGNFIADPLKAKPWECASIEISRGMKTHILIDSFSDKHEAFKRSKKRLKEKGLLKGIIVDFTYDYLLIKNWDKFSTISLDEFTSRFYKQANLAKLNYPQRPKEIVSNMIQRDLLNYSDLEHLRQAFARLDRRVSPKLAQRDSAISYYEIVCEKMPQLEEDFLEFFPALIKETTKDLEPKRLKHIKL